MRSGGCRIGASHPGDPAARPRPRHELSDAADAELPVMTTPNPPRADTPILMTLSFAMHNDDDSPERRRGYYGPNDFVEETINDDRHEVQHGDGPLYTRAEQTDAGLRFEMKAVHRARSKDRSTFAFAWPKPWNGPRVSSGRLNRSIRVRQNAGLTGSWSAGMDCGSASKSLASGNRRDGPRPAVTGQRAATRRPKRLPRTSGAQFTESPWLRIQLSFWRSTPASLPTTGSLTSFTHLSGFTGPS